ncbi:coiled-coil domain-containing protein 63-like [Pectinophora gossypiella]|uniref:coiled-coil domain-containing protein 63-like n=1 Tax=Pectinophora gossypiella TaxID=13191 RepID=UPI00214F3287|nr:coiled-coil domain-containing protein 63-like [Pectinophora gossypiella]
MAPDVSFPTPPCPVFESTFHTDLGDMEVLKKMEDEHLRLQRQFRAIQADRRNRTAGVHPIFRKQEKLLKVLKAEYIDLTKDLKIASTGAHKKKNKRMKVELNRALLLRTRNMNMHDDSVTVMEQLKGLNRRNNKEALTLKKLVSAKTGQIRERMAQSESRLVITENRLESVMLRFNQVRYENKKIREEIEHMLKDRALFNQAWGKMMKVLGQGKKFLTDLFESSTLAYDQRDEWCTKLKSVQEKGRVDQMTQLQEMRDLQKAFDHEMKMFHFLAKKGVVRVNVQQEEYEEKMKENMEKELQEKLDYHVNILDTLIEYTNLEKAHDVIEDFVRKEHSNFAIYELLTEYCAENVMLTKDLIRRRQLLLDRKDWNDKQEERRQSRLAEFSRQVELQRQRNQLIQDKVDEKDQILKNGMGKITELFEMLGCSLQPFQNLLGDKSPSCWQLSLTVKMITKKINEYLQIVYYYERYFNKKVQEKKSTSLLKKFTVNPPTVQPFTAIPINVIAPSDPCPACIETRWLSRVLEQEEAPFDKQMAREAIQELSNDIAYLRSDRIHPLAECRAPRSRVLLAARYTS